MIQVHAVGLAADGSLTTCTVQFVAGLGILVMGLMGFDSLADGTESMLGLSEHYFSEVIAGVTT